MFFYVKNFCLFIVVFFLCGTVFSGTSWAAEGSEPVKAVERSGGGEGMAVPALVAKDTEGKSVPMTLAGYDVNVTVQSFAAEVVATMIFRNQTERDLAGNLYFPLPEGVTVDGYALDVDGEMIDGVAVTKERARVTYEKVVRQKIDPGLVEWSGGNSFKTRVFPLPAGGTRTIRVKYITFLETDPRTNEQRFRLPLKFASAVEDFRLRLEVIKPECPPEVAKGALQDLTFTWRESYVAETQRKNFLPNDDLVILLPRKENSDSLARNILVSSYSGNEEKVRFGNEKIYFALQAKCPNFEEVPGVQKQEIRMEGLQEKMELSVFWDASGSRADKDFTKEYEFLEYFLKTCSASEISLDLVVFRNVACPAQRFIMGKESRAADVEKLIQTLKELPYDGGTAPGAIKFSSCENTGNTASSRAFLFTDGIWNFGNQKCGKVSEARCPLHVFASGSQVDTPRLREMAILNGGSYFHLNKITPEKIVAEMNGRPVILSKIEGTNILLDETFPKLDRPVMGDIIVAGRMTAPTGELVLTYSVDGNVCHVQKYELTAETGNSRLAERVYAQTKLAELVIFPEENREKIESLGKEFGLVTPETSLLVLDSLQQYLDYEICPPESLPEMRDEYLRRMDTVEKQQAESRLSKMEEVLAMWENRVTWWSTEFKYPKDFKYKSTEEDAEEAGDSSDFFGGDEGTGVPHLPEAASSGFAGRMENDAEGNSPQEIPVPVMEAEDEEGIIEQQQYEEIIVEDSESAVSEFGMVMKKSVVREQEVAREYLDAMKAAGAEKAYAEYLKFRKDFAEDSRFFMECATLLEKMGKHDLAVRVISNLAELELENVPLLRILARRLMQMNEPALAVDVFRRIKRMRAEEPHSYRDLALALILSTEGKPATDQSVKNSLLEALELLKEVVLNPWDERFSEIELFALDEMNVLVIPRLQEAGVKELSVDERLVKKMDLDFRIVMEWDADNTDIDLWVTEPSDEKVNYQHNLSTIGGMISRDFTQGYGPEEYLIKTGMSGKYLIQAHYYGSQSVELLGPVTVQAEVYTDWGRPTQTRKVLMFQLDNVDGTFTIGEVEK
ncbi:MAG: VIT domain-containing protein [Planctomycetia bacterium]|nr:VIT domain-containing protein [Planctomycetia bacterium]